MCRTARSWYCEHALPTATNSFVTVSFAKPVMRTVALIELPSISADITWTCLARLSLFMGTIMPKRFGISQEENACTNHFSGWLERWVTAALANRSATQRGRSADQKNRLHFGFGLIIFFSEPEGAALVSSPPPPRPKGGYLYESLSGR